CAGPDPVQAGPARHHPGARLAIRPRGEAALPAAAGRHRLDRVLVPGGAARALPRARRRQRAGGDLILAGVNQGRPTGLRTTGAREMTAQPTQLTLVSSGDL